MRSIIDKLYHNQPDILEEMFLASGLKSDTPPFNRVTFERLHELSRYIMLSGAHEELPKARGYLRDLQLGILQILKEFDRVCTEANITYWLISGCLLGAARHKGFIPWDDDLDVFMLRNDYERLVNEFNQRTRIKDLTASLVAVSRGRVFIQIRSQSTNQLYMDVFPCDIIPEKLDHQRQMELSDALNKAKLAVLFEKGDAVSPYRYYRDTMKKIIPNINQPGDYEDATFVFPFDAWPMHNYMGESSDYFPQSKIEFEGLLVPTLGKVESFLYYFYFDYYKYPSTISLHHHGENLDAEMMLAVKNFLHGQYEEVSEVVPEEKKRAKPHLIKMALQVYAVVQKIRRSCVKIFDVRTADNIKRYSLFGKSWVRRRPQDKKAARFYFEGIEVFSQLYHPLSDFPPARGYLRTIQLAQLKILKMLTRLCREKALHFWLHNETLLGAVRHNGFIPWNAGAAVMMPRRDYNMVADLINAADKNGALETRLVAAANTGVFTRIASRAVPEIRLDVFPCDFLSRKFTYTERKLFTKTIVKALREHETAPGCEREKQAYFDDFRDELFAGAFTEDAESCQTVLFGCESMPITVLGMFDREDVLPPVDATFEGEQYPSPRNSDYILTALYGDYQTRHDGMNVNREFNPHYHMKAEQIEAFLNNENL